MNFPDVEDVELHIKTRESDFWPHGNVSGPQTLWYVTKTPVENTNL